MSLDRKASCISPYESSCSHNESLAGLSTSLETQVQQMLEVVGSGLKSAANHAVKHAENKEAAEARAAERRRLNTNGR